MIWRVKWNRLSVALDRFGEIVSLEKFIAFVFQLGCLQDN